MSSVNLSVCFIDKGPFQAQWAETYSWMYHKTSPDINKNQKVRSEAVIKCLALVLQQNQDLDAVIFSVQPA